MPPPLRSHREVEYESACFRRQATGKCTTAGSFTTRVLAISCPRALLASAFPDSTSPQRDRGRGRSNLPDRSDRAAAHISRGAGRSAGRWIVAIARPCPRLLVIVECCPARDILDTEQQLRVHVRQCGHHQQSSASSSTHSSRIPTGTRLGTCLRFGLVWWSLTSSASGLVPSSARTLQLWQNRSSVRLVRARRDNSTSGTFSSGPARTCPGVPATNLQRMSFTLNPYGVFRRM